MKIDESRIVKTGEWLYDGTIPCQIVITLEDLFPGTGDGEDPPEIANDRHVPCVQIWYENPSQPGDFKAGGGYAWTVAEAVRRVESTIRSKVRWKT